MDALELYWIPEYRYFASDHEVEAALREIGANRAGRRRAILGGLLVLPPLALALMFPIQHWTGRLHLPPMCGHAALVAILTLAAGLIALNPWGRARLRRKLRAYLAARGVPICIVCGYDLRGQRDSRCPECFTPSEVLLRQMSEPPDDPASRPPS